MKTYTNPIYSYTKPADLDGTTRHWPVIVAGAGPVGLAAAIDLAQRGIDVLVLDEDNTVSVGSRAICWSKRTLEILDRLGCGERLVEKGVRWSVGRVFFRDEQVYEFNLLPESGHHRPAFINLQQYWVEQFLVERTAELPEAEIRWQNKIVGVEQQADRVTVRVATPDGEYRVHADWLIAADGARSPIRGMLGQESEGQVFRDRFLIADIHMTSDFPAERWFWFDPPFHRNQSALLHRQADHVWRVDFQLGWEADPEQEKKPENILPRLRSMLGEKAQFEIEWASVYTFQCRRMRKFRHGRVLFVGDAAHLVSPFGARGANSGIQDVDNLVWKLELVMEDLAPQALTRHVRQRAHRRRRRKYSRHDAQYGLHHAQGQRQPYFPQRRAGSREGAPVRAAPGQQRQTVGACDPRTLDPEHAGPSRRRVFMHDGSRRMCCRRPRCRTEWRLVARPSDGRLCTARFRGIGTGRRDCGTGRRPDPLRGGPGGRIADPGRPADRG